MDNNFSSHRPASSRTSSSLATHNLIRSRRVDGTIATDEYNPPAHLNVISHSLPPSSIITAVSNVPSSLPDLSGSILSFDDQQRLSALIQSFPHVFTASPGRTHKLQHRIEILENTKPRNLPPYRYSPARRAIIETQLQEMLAEGVITTSKSPWSSPVVLIPKKDGTIRFCVDYRKLNEVTIRDAYPLPRIDDTLDALHNAKFVSTLDLRSGYWQVELDSDSRPLTAFVTHKGLFECVVMPFGLTNAPATFQRLLDVVLAGLKWQCCLVYLDDIVVYSSTFEQHLLISTRCSLPLVHRG